MGDALNYSKDQAKSNIVAALGAANLVAALSGKIKHKGIATASGAGLLGLGLLGKYKKSVDYQRENGHEYNASARALAAMASTPLFEGKIGTYLARRAKDEKPFNDKLMANRERYESTINRIRTANKDLHIPSDLLNRDISINDRDPYLNLGGGSETSRRLRRINIDSLNAEADRDDTYYDTVNEKKQFRKGNR